MKKLLYSLLIIASATLSAQKNPNTRFAVSEDAVGTIDFFTSRKEFVQSTNAYKAANLPQNLKKFSYLAENGLSEVKMKKSVGPLDRISLSIINEQFKVPKDSPVFIDGYEFSDTSTQIYPEILAKADVKEHNGKKALFISTQR